MACVPWRDVPVLRHVSPCRARFFLNQFVMPSLTFPSRPTRPDLEFSSISPIPLVFLPYMRENTFNGENLSPVAEDGRAKAYQTNALNQYTAITEEGAAPFHPTYDANGNQTLIQTATGIWAVDYDFFGQPIKFTRGTTVITCGYDYMGRRWFRKITEDGTVVKHERYLYRGYQQIATVDLMQPQPTVRHVIIWDPSEPTATRPLALLAGGQLYLYGVDFSKNVMDSATGTLAATYDYSPFGAVTSSGGLAAVNPLQWSSEVYDPATALVYYNYRYLNTTDGRWISRDRIAEQGGLNLYEFVGNNAIGINDYLGLNKIRNCKRKSFHQGLEKVGDVAAEVEKLRKLIEALQTADNAVALLTLNPKKSVLDAMQEFTDRILGDKHDSYLERALKMAKDLREEIDKVREKTYKELPGFPMSIYIEIEYEECNGEGTWESKSQWVDSGIKSGNRPPILDKKPAFKIDLQKAEKKAFEKIGCPLKKK